MVWLLNYGAGNVRSVRNAVRRLGFQVQDVLKPEDIAEADKLIFPGVGSFGYAMKTLSEKGYTEPLKRYLVEDRPFLGICLGLQLLFEGSEESPGVPGLGVIPGYVQRFSGGQSVPHMGWNGVSVQKHSKLLPDTTTNRFYFVHSYRAIPDAAYSDWDLTTTNYGGNFVSGVQKGNIAAFQFHPEKSGDAGLQLLGAFLHADELPSSNYVFFPSGVTSLAKRVVACLDVRRNDEGHLVVTKGHQYDVREAGKVRNLGEPVELALRYYEEGADEIAFLDITGFRDLPLQDTPMLEVLREASENVFVPLSIGGGIRDYTDREGRRYTALEVADEYFRSGADKVSIGSDAVAAAEEFRRTGEKTGTSSIERITKVYGSQAVVVSIDPRRVYVRSPEDTSHHIIQTAQPGPKGETHCWYQCTVKGGREGRDIGAFELAQAVQELGAGEILLNCMDRDGTKRGYDLELIRDITDAVGIPVIASSGAGSPEHFADVFEKTDAEAALGAGIFHRREVPIAVVKNHLRIRGISVR